VAAEVALVMCSSASVERVFSLPNCMFDLIKDIIENRDIGCESLVASLSSIINKPANGLVPSGKDTLRLELALIKDAGEPIASFCNHFEGDGFHSNGPKLQ
jgi:hypothetical protein